jgi:hypothetical protein
MRWKQTNSSIGPARPKSAKTRSFAMIRKISHTVIGTTIAAVGAVALLAPAASATVPTGHDQRMGVNATALDFGGYRMTVPAGSSTQTAVTVPTTGACPSGFFESVGVGAEQKGSMGLLGARIYSQCIGGVPQIDAMFETTGGPVAMSTIGALAPGDIVAIFISTSGGFTTVSVNGPLGSDSMTVPDIVSAGYRVGIWPMFSNHNPAKMQNFGKLKIYKNVVNSAPQGSWGPTRVHLVYASLVKRAKTSLFNSWGDIFKIKWLNP